MHTRRRQSIWIILSVLLIAIFAPTVRASDLDESITKVQLRSTVRMHADQTQLTIADIASVVGPQHQRIETLAVPTKQVTQGTWTQISIKSIRELLDATPSIHAGSIIVVGNDIAITRRAPSDAAPNAIAAVSQAPVDQSPTLRDYMLRWIYTKLDKDPDSVRIQFNQRDNDFLATPTHGRIIELQEIGKSTSMGCRIIIYENERIVTDSTIRFDVQIERVVRVITNQIRRNELITNDNTDLETRWMSPREPIASPTESLNKVCKTTLDPGTILESSMLESQTLVKRGQIVSARSLAGSVSVSMSVRALADGSLGDIIELESRDRKQRFTARVAANGRVVIVQTPPSTAP